MLVFENVYFFFSLFFVSHTSTAVFLFFLFIFVSILRSIYSMLKYIQVCISFVHVLIYFSIASFLSVPFHFVWSLLLLCASIQQYVTSVVVNFFLFDSAII